MTLLCGFECGKINKALIGKILIVSLQKLNYFKGNI
jgi:hypothetical protein